MTHLREEQGQPDNFGRSASSAAPDGPKTFAEVEPSELAHDGAMVQPRPSIGLALSGGGIRSATFALGVLQALAARKKLSSFDYLSTVSGGGYIGCWLSAWIHRTSLPHVEEQLARHGSHGGSYPDTNEPAEVSWLRRYSNYLAPKLGLFSADSLTLITTWLRNVFLNLLILVGFLVSVLLIPRLLLKPALWATVHSKEFGWAAAWIATLFLLAIAFNLWQQGQPPRSRRQWLVSRRGVFWTVSLPGILAAIFGGIWLLGDPQCRVDLNDGDFQLVTLTLVSLLGMLWAVLEWHRRPCPSGGNDRAHILKGALIYAMALAVSLGLGFALLCGVPWLFRDLWRSKEALDTTVGFLTFGPPGLLVDFGICGSVFVGLVGRAYFERSREWWSRMNAWFITLGMVWFILFALAFYAPPLVEWAYVAAPGWARVLLSSTWIGALLAALLAPKPSSLSKQAQYNLETILNVAATIFVAGLVLLVAAMTSVALTAGASQEFHSVANSQKRPEFGLTVRGASGTVDARVDWTYSSVAPVTEFVSARLKDLAELQQTSHNIWGLDYHVAVALGVGAVLLLFAWRVDINKFSLHDMYKTRLVRCYLGASNLNRQAEPFTGLDEHDDFPLAALAQLTRDRDVQRPFHIINATMNISQGRNLAWQERKAASFVLTSKYCGFALARTQGDSTRFKGTLGQLPGYRPTDKYLNRDAGTSREDAGRASIMSEDNGLTLGMAMATSGAAASPNMGYLTQPALAFLLTLFNVRLGRWCSNPARDKWTLSSPRFGLICLLQELFAYSNEDRNFIYLSDGGHFDNLGLYELIRRRCSVIVVVDAGADPKRTFDDLANAVRKCRIDFGVELDVPLDQVRGETPSQLAQEGFALGTIYYEPANPNGPKGSLLLIKPTLRLKMDEPADVLAYSCSNPAFPQQSTVNQFFEESQFESYRRLGFFITQRCLGQHGAILPSTPITWPAGSTSQPEEHVERTSLMRWFRRLVGATVLGAVILSAFAQTALGVHHASACWFGAYGLGRGLEACASLARELLTASTIHHVSIWPRAIGEIGLVRLWLFADNVFILVYTSMFLVGYVGFVKQRFEQRPGFGRGLSYVILASLAIGGAIADYAENFQIIAHLPPDPLRLDQLTYAIAEATRLKWILFSANTLLLIGLGVVVRFWKAQGTLR